MNKLNALSLIELIITMTIVSTLIAISSSTLSTLKLESHRKEAHSELIRFKASIEQFAISGRAPDGTPNGAKVDSSVAVAQKFKDLSKSITTPNNYYNIIVSAVNPSGTTPGYTLTATAPSGSPQHKDTPCIAISLQILAGSDDVKTPDICWQ